MSALNTRLFVLYHRHAVLELVPPLPEFTKINLSTVRASHRSNMIGECRAFLSDLDIGDAEYVGFVNGRWDRKYYMLSTRIAGLPGFVDDAIASGSLARDKVVGPWPTDCYWLDLKNDWYDFTMSVHPSMGRLLRELRDFTGMGLITGRRSLWANDFICHRSVYYEFMAHWRRCFDHFHGKYGYLLPFSTGGVDTARYAAYFYERCSTIFWANRHDLTVNHIP